MFCIGQKLVIYMSPVRQICSYQSDISLICLISNTNIVHIILPLAEYMSFWSDMHPMKQICISSAICWSDVHIGGHISHPLARYRKYVSYLSDVSYQLHIGHKWVLICQICIKTLSYWSNMSIFAQIPNWLVRYKSNICIQWQTCVQSARYYPL